MDVAIHSIVERSNVDAIAASVSRILRIFIVAEETKFQLTSFLGKVYPIHSIDKWLEELCREGEVSEWKAGRVGGLAETTGRSLSYLHLDESIQARCLGLRQGFEPGGFLEEQSKAELFESYE
jgi:hypothetical protein